MERTNAWLGQFRRLLVRHEWQGSGHSGFDDLPVSESLEQTGGAQTALIEELTKKKAFDDDLRGKLHAALKEYVANFKAELAAVKA